MDYTNNLPPVPPPVAFYPSDATQSFDAMSADGQTQATNSVPETMATSSSSSSSSPPSVVGDDSTVQPPPSSPLQDSSTVGTFDSNDDSNDAGATSEIQHGSVGVAVAENHQTVSELLDVDFSSSLPLGVPSQDESDEEAADRENQHSLPSPEELKVNVGVSQGSRGRGCFAYPRACFLLLFLCIIGVIIGVSLGVTKEQRQENNADTYHGGDDRLYHMKEYLIANGVTSRSDFEAGSKSPQFQAADWLAHEDRLEIGIPKGDLTTDSGYDFLTRYVMAVLYYATNGHSWRNPLLFLSDKITCDWFQVFPPPVGEVGVLCNQNTRKIVGFSFISNNLEGTLPTELSQLTTMTYVESIGNSINGTLPSQLQNLSNLRTLVMPFNSLTGRIPSWLSEWTKMEFLYLSNNFFTGTIPSAIGQLTGMSVLALDDNMLKGSMDLVWKLHNLEYLYLEDNELTGTLPEEIESMHPLLINLDLSDNKMSGSLSKDLFRLHRLEVLDLHNNGFTGHIPDDINADNERLTFVALHQNQLNSSIPETIGNLRKLSHLDVSENKLTGTIPFEMDLLSDMTFLFLGANNYTKGQIPIFVYTFDKLRELSLKSTKRSGKISELIGNLDKLIMLDLDENDLTGEIPSEIGLLTNLEFLLLNRNELTSTVPTQLGNLQYLRFLLLDNNHLLGDLSLTCANEGLGVVYVDCGEIECPEECCNCCVDGKLCHDYDAISHLDPIWEASYDRQFFDFSSGDEDEAFDTTDDDKPPSTP